MRFGMFGGQGIKVGRILGIPIRLDLSFFFVFALVVFLIATQIMPDSMDGLGGAERWLYGLVGGAVYFLSLLIHELAHSLMARRYGMEVSSITLFFFGGVSLIREDSQRPGQEFWIAVVGPLASLVLGAGFTFVALFALSDGTALRNIVFVLGVLNCILAAFNMLPGFPLDGGRVMRSLVWRLTGSRHRATRASARLGQLLGAAMIVYGIGGLLTEIAFFDMGFNSLWLALIGFLLMTQAAQGVKAAELERDLASLRVGELMLEPPVARTAEADLLVRVLAPSRAQLDQQDVFIVAEGGIAVGIASAVQILLLDEERYQSDRLRDIMLAADQVQPLQPDSGADEALQRLQKERTFVLPVVERGRLLGVVGLEQILKALGQGPPPRLDPSAGA
ncbi:MAG: site-2 protease family protein [Chloroflexota bacterium]|nr:site-2 protease family protein [Chloroflexota bacterium]